MVRHVAPVLVALCISPSWLGAQTTGTTTMKVTAPSADVYMSPSTGSPVIGHVSQGTVLVVTRELGSWVKVPWPDGESGNGYLHVSKGTIGHEGTGDRAAGSAPSTQAAARRTTTVAAAPVGARTSSGEQLHNPVYVARPTHVVGVGGLVAGPTAGFGASARAWRHDRFGVQFDISRYAVTSAATPGRVTSLQFEPSGLYSMRDRVSDSWWLRPYVGSGLSLQRQTLTAGASGIGVPVSDSSAGFHVFGGGEMTFPSMPRFTISADVGYRWMHQPFPGFETDGLGISVSGRWYVR